MTKLKQCPVYITTLMYTGHSYFINACPVKMYDR